MATKSIGDRRQPPQPEEGDYSDDDKINAGWGMKSVLYGYLVKFFTYFDEHFKLAVIIFGVVITLIVVLVRLYQLNSRSNQGYIYIN